MGIAPEMKLVIKRTFLEFVEETSAHGSLRPRSFTDSNVRLTATYEKKNVEHENTANECEDDGSQVNQSATEELKAFLGLGCGELAGSPVKLPGSPAKFGPRSPARSPMLPPLCEEEYAGENQCTWPLDPSSCSSYPQVDVITPLTLPECSMTSWWVPVAVHTKPVLQISDMISPPLEEMQQEYYMGSSKEYCMPQHWQNSVTIAFGTPYVPDAAVAKRAPAILATTHCSCGNLFLVDAAYCNVCGRSRHAEGRDHEKTTVILRNLPNNYTRAMFLELLHSEGFAHEYDFIYIPVDFTSQAGLGYAFVNLVTPSAALAFWAHFEGFRRWSLPSEKVCTLNWSSPIQGLEAHVDRYRNSPVMHEAVPDDWKPAIYFGGERVVFPPPTKSIKAPKLRSSKVTTTP